MSRRPPNPSAEKVAKNSQAIKSLLKLEANKLCADCKRNKHPRWASWNLGVFICIRCSGIHRGMGTHISRVKSVDLDSWTDEQLASIVSWGNARAKKYWEAKLAPDHLPSESKIENFIRTKYELKRWVMDGPIPDPSTLDDDDDDDVPLAVVKEKQLERRESLRAQQAAIVAPPPATTAIDLIGGPDPIPRSSSGPPAQRVPPKAEAAPPKTTTASTKDSLLGLDFFQPAAPPRPASTTGSAGGLSGQSRPDLKQSILSLYASAPKPQPPQQQTAQAPGGGMFGSMPSPTRSQGSVGGINDAFGSLSFSSQPAKPADPFANLGSGSTMSPKTSTGSAFGALSGGSFFDTKPAAQTTAAPHQRQMSSNSAFGDFGGFSSPSPTVHKPAQPSSSAFGDLFDLSSPASQTTSPPPSKPAPAPAPAPAPMSSTVFNLSSATQPKPPTAATTTTSNPLPASNAWSNSSDVWGSNAWGAPEAKSPNISQPATTTATATTQPNDFGWGSSPTAGSFASQSIVPGASGFAPAPKVAADEEFGGWTSSSGPAAGSAKPASGFGGNDDLFSNVWQ